MRPDRNADVLEDAVIFLDRGMVDRHARVIDRLVHHPERIGLRRPAEIVDRLRPVALTGGVDLVDRADLARLRLVDQLLVVEFCNSDDPLFSLDNFVIVDFSVPVWPH